MVLPFGNKRCSWILRVCEWEMKTLRGTIGYLRWVVRRFEGI